MHVNAEENKHIHTLMQRLIRGKLWALKTHAGVSNHTVHKLYVSISGCSLKRSFFKRPTSAIKLLAAFFAR